MTEQLKVLTFNIHHGAGTDDRLDLGRIADVIAEQEADIVALQEVDRHFDERSGFADQAWILGQHLEMTAVFGAGFRLPPPGPGLPEREYGSALLSTLPIMAWRFLPLPTWPGQEQRGVLCADIVIGEHSIMIGCTHLSYEDAEPLLAQTRSLARIIDDRSRPTVLLGDLNAEPDRPELQPLTEILTDGWAASGAGPGWTFPAEAPEKRIDYVFASPHFSVDEIIVIDSGNASDHRGVLATLSLDVHART